MVAGTSKAYKITKNRLQLLLMASLGFLFLIVFAYIPMFGIVLAFKQGDGYLNILDAMVNSPWAGLDNFRAFLTDRDFLNVMRNTIGLNLLQLAINFPAPIIFALLINEIRAKGFRRRVQTVANFPHFLSWVIFGGIILMLLNMDTGVVNAALIRLGFVDEAVNFGEARYFWGTIIITSLMKGIGWGSLIYVAAISGIDPTLYEAAEIDGANRFQKMRHITIPSIAGTITLFFILSVSNLLSNGFEHIWVFQNQINLSRSEVIDTYVYKHGIIGLRYSYTTAVGLFKSIVAFILLLSGHYTSKRLTGRGVF